MSATVIGASTRVLGSIEVSGHGAGGDLVIEGRVEGSVRASGSLTLGPRAEVSGEIVARDVRIAGCLRRNIQASGIIHLTSTAEVHGDLEATRVVIDDGAIFEGQVRLRRAATQKSQAAAPTHAAQAAPTHAPIAPQPAAREVPALATPGRRRLQRRGP